MQIKNVNIIDRLGFFLQIALIFILIQAIIIALGYFDAEVIALALLLVSALVFALVLIFARSKDKKHKNSFSASL